eukprot:Polyplicarium_translucidae@DN4255_c0_g1_i1.p1
MVTTYLDRVLSKNSGVWCTWWLSARCFRKRMPNSHRSRGSLQSTSGCRSSSTFGSATRKSVRTFCRQRVAVLCLLNPPTQSTFFVGRFICHGMFVAVDDQFLQFSAKGGDLESHDCRTSHGWRCDATFTGKKLEVEISFKYKPGASGEARKFIEVLLYDSRFVPPSAAPRSAATTALCRPP